MKNPSAQLLWCLCCLSVGVTAQAQAQTPQQTQPTQDVAPAAAPSTVPAPAPVATTDEAQRTAIARALFDEGLRFVDAAQWSDAADRFARVLEIRYSAVVAYNYGLAQARLGKLVLAAETLRKLMADESLDPQVRESALALRHNVDAKLAWLTLEIDGDKTGCRLLVDDQSWPAAAWGVAVPIDPGAHTIVLQRGSETLRSVPLDLAPGAHVEQTMAAHKDAPTPTQVAASAVHDDERPALGDAAPPPKRGVLRSPWFWAAVGVVTAGVVTTVVLAPGSSTDAAPAVKGDFSPGAIEGAVTP